MTTMYDIVCDGKIKQVCGNYNTAVEFKKKYKQSGYNNVEIKERKIYL